MTDATAKGAKPPGPLKSAAKTGAAAKPFFSPGYKRIVLSLLVTAYTFNFIDRTIIATIGQAIKVDLKITDAQLGLLGGLYFALLYTFLGIPLARFAERFNRVNIISGAIVIWSAFTALCGMAGSFLTLSIFRFGVGVGEAGLSPPAHSLISDYFEPKKRASALAIYSLGIPIGTMFGAVLGGWLAQAYGWRVAFMVVGLPGLLLALSIKALIKEPPRGHSEVESTVAVATPVAAPKATLGSELKEIGAVIALLFGKWPVLNMILGITLVSFGGYGSGQFVPPYFIRTFGLNYAQVGLITGLVGAAGQAVGTVLGGWITTRMVQRGDRWYALTPAIGVTLSIPFIIAVYTAGSWQHAAMWLALPGIFSYVYLGPTFAVVQNMAPTHRRATATAIMFFFLNLLALGFGPPIVGLVIDHFAAFHLAHPDQAGVWQAIGGLFEAVPSFNAACPGGMAPKGAGEGVAAACHTAQVLATRHGILVGYGAGLWGAIHYFIASFGIAKALADARAARGEAD